MTCLIMMKKVMNILLYQFFEKFVFFYHTLLNFLSTSVFLRVNFLLLSFYLCSSECMKCLYPLYQSALFPYTYSWGSRGEHGILADSVVPSFHLVSKFQSFLLPLPVLVNKPSEFFLCTFLSFLFPLPASWFLYLVCHSIIIFFFLTWAMRISRIRNEVLFIVSFLHVLDIWMNVYPIFFTQLLCGSDDLIYGKVFCQL